MLLVCVCFRSVARIGTGNPTPNPGYELSQVQNFHPYFFSERGAYRTDDVASTDLALTIRSAGAQLSDFHRSEVPGLCAE